MIKTVATTAGVNTVTFPEFYKYFWIKNTGDTTVYASAYSNVSAGVDNTCVINSGDAVCIENVDSNSVYISGAGSVEIHAQDIPDCSFKAGAKGGGSGGSGGGMELIGSYVFTYSGTETNTFVQSDIIQILPEIPEKNRTFLIYAQMKTGETTKYNYSCIVKMFGNTADNTTNVVRLQFGGSKGYEPDLYLETMPSRYGNCLMAHLNNFSDYFKSFRYSIDIYDMGVIE